MWPHRQKIALFVCACFYLGLRNSFLLVLLLIILFLNFCYILSLGGGECPCLGTGVEIKGQLIEVNPLLSLCGANDRAEVILVGGQCLYPTSQLTDPVSGFLFLFWLVFGLVFRLFFFFL